MRARNDRFGRSNEISCRNPTSSRSSGSAGRSGDETPWNDPTAARTRSPSSFRHSGTSLASSQNVRGAMNLFLALSLTKIWAPCSSRPCSAGNSWCMAPRAAWNQTIPPRSNHHIVAERVATPRASLRIFKNLRQGGEARVRVRAERTAAYAEVVKDGNWEGPLVQVVKPNAVRRENPAILPRCRRHDG